MMKGDGDDGLDEYEVSIRAFAHKTVDAESPEEAEERAAERVRTGDLEVEETIPHRLNAIGESDNGE